MNHIRILLVGFGSMSRLAWFPLLTRYPGVKLAGCVDANPRAFQKELADGLLEPDICHTDFDLAVARLAPDAVIIATPPEIHEEVCMKAAKAGLPVLCEKPLAHEPGAARRMVDYCKEQNVLLMVAQNRRHTAAIHTLRHYVSQGIYGCPGQAYLQFRQVFSRDSYRDSMAHPLLMDMANHHFDAARYVLGQEPKSVTAIGWNPLWSRFQGIASAVCVFEYEKPLRLVYDASWHAMNGEMTSNGCDWRIECAHGVLLCRKDVVYGIPAGDHPSGSYGGDPQPLPMLELPCDTTSYLLREFLTAIQNAGTAETTGEDNLKTLSMVFGAIRSVDTQRKAVLD